MKKKHKQNMDQEALRYQKSKQENEVMQIRLKEKQQELKLSNLKITELKKTLGPIKRMRNLENESINDRSEFSDFKKSIPNKFLTGDVNQQLYTFRKKNAQKPSSKGESLPSPIKLPVLPQHTLSPRPIAHGMEKLQVLPKYALSPNLRDRVEIDYKKNAFAQQRFSESIHSKKVAIIQEEPWEHKNQSGPKLAERSQRSRQRSRMKKQNSQMS